MGTPDSTIPFNSSAFGTLGVEMEWMCVDGNSGSQIPAAPNVFAAVGNTPRIKPELFTSIVETNTDIQRNTPDAMRQLAELYRDVDAVLRKENAALLSSGTHPVSHWREQVVSDDTRYYKLLKRLQWVARRFNICGIHVHVGMPDGDTCIKAMNHLLPIMPIFLAISANSPFWHGEKTGLAASRIKIFEGLSQGGMPFYFADWKDFEHCTARLTATGSIESVRDIWWEMRPHPDFGTLEVRIGDMPTSYNDTAAYIAYVRAEAMAAAQDSERPKVHPSLIRENRWRACRYGIRATIIDPFTEELVPVLDWLEHRLQQLADQGYAASELELVSSQIDRWRNNGGGAESQRELFDTTDDFSAMIRAMRELDGWSNRCE
ncbi:carboxylate-amine ligase [Mariprofundus ferrinatatus]|uniref:Putative glutamate--cysteine ligase 2 n=1 Tax=Mariprofundus ferrinatatus TaxID=1921087 RepID=A0A2K8L460_9PROT|nr:YbdK family carboxylate-amine ligase [Mariprofundus ferrinatatus]ATX82033.1 carboxylate-amine ligase [Mariprofundus ferrinatatus]